MKDREKLKKLVQIIGDILKVEGNEWLIDEILKTIGETSSVEEIAKHAVIQNIHEFCVEQKISKQATDFYHLFPIEEIKDQLILDYKKMEHERRRDDFENFCLCLYQQIENITNYLFDKKVSFNWEKERNTIAIKSDWNIERKEYVFPPIGGTKLEQLVFQGTDSTKWYSNRKLRAVLYFFYFNKNVIKDDYLFNSVYFTHEEIYQMRNQNHRGTKPSAYQQMTLDKIIGNEGRYYFKFYGFLQDYITHIEKALGNKLSTKSNLNTFSANKKKSSDTLGDNPEIAKLFDKFKEKG